MIRDALVVGVNRYPFLKDSPTNEAQHLTTPAFDAEALAYLLETHGNFTVRRLPENLIDGTLQVDQNKSVTAGELEDAIAQLFKTIRIWNLHSEKLLCVLTEHSDTVYSLAFSPDAQTLVSSSADMTVKIWRLSF
ncbi:hypothetical protein MC7420_4149 [Coleofasciculus chthonoplastes PCC 7420]|mgnify:CR=1 FL=1|uniref:Uncharacterized protein n=1 Tax=Coleofasciculus chthonoplastes PCC 7420 TaxID=118168 RepID=B4VVF1_9CYAN|nr:hypothetical protein [Coleofasciculus chthonoplastes]EDX74164.1 hypothetical protein MC7420_4149 [Coleofasciculus chthonoplastes PCC 7420]